MKKNPKIHTKIIAIIIQKEIDMKINIINLKAIGVGIEAIVEVEVEQKVEEIDIKI